MHISSHAQTRFFIAKIIIHAKCHLIYSRTRYLEREGKIVGVSTCSVSGDLCWISFHNFSLAIAVRFNET